LKSAFEDDEPKAPSELFILKKKKKKKIRKAASSNNNEKFMSMIDLIKRDELNVENIDDSSETNDDNDNDAKTSKPTEQKPSDDFLLYLLNDLHRQQSVFIYIIIIITILIKEHLLNLLF
jgi:hypothetical protein